MDEYKKKYKKLKAAIKKAYLFAQTNSTKAVLENILPELRESEDERIRKSLRSYLRGLGEFEYPDKETYNNWLAWLEKQGEPIDKIEPKFHKGEWVVWQDKCYKVNFNGCGYELIDQNGLSTSLEYGTIDENAHLWTIANAKEGDVLACPLPKSYEPGEQIFIFKSINSRDYVDNCIEYYCRICEGVFYENKNGGYMGTTSTPLYPATKDQRDTLEKAMRNAGWEFDFEKKELKKLSQQEVTKISQQEATKISFNMPKIGGKYVQLRTENLLKQINSEVSITKRHHLINRYLNQREKQIEKVLANIEDDDIDLTLVVEQLWEDIQLAHKQIRHTIDRIDFYADYHALVKWDGKFNG